ncbi:hypothetical protein [Leifsonia shinshuensis]|uniref:hypothetical protein n=1 Tax=Leifsonia shinshuensis TaxID=150026 RepID=UPI0028636212|nr:hypothetical protein [Leifsonia shinshuensis]MDR6970771.1 peptidoglycan/LPS O-acetylase OafA/YrhL [Leifsonia shinshuensis]
MGERQGEPRWFRVAFGKPRTWNGVVWLALAACWFAVSIVDGGQPWRYLLAALWAVLGGVVLTVAVRDRRHAGGAYAPPVVERQD